jgi:DNA-binding GntR family transcriptional regulator
MPDLPDGAIDRSSPVPFYYQLAELLEREIASGRWPADSRVPPELLVRNLARLFAYLPG